MSKRPFANMTPAEREDLRRGFIEEFEQAAEAIRALPDSGYVLMFDNGLCVQFDMEAQKISVCGVLGATVLPSRSALRPADIQNGKGERPRLVTRAQAKQHALRENQAALAILINPPPPAPEF